MAGSPRAAITVDHSSSHSQGLSSHFQLLYEQGLFTDCELQVEEQQIACHRVVLSAYSPVLHNMLASGMTESHTNSIPVVGFSADIMVGLVGYMYSGVLHVKDEQLREALIASDFYEMTALKHSLDKEARFTVDPSCVINWREFAAVYSLPVTTDYCERILMLKFRQVVQHEEFLGLSEEEVIQYFQMCQPYADQIGHDVLLQAAVLWLACHEETNKSAELLGCMRLEACTKRTLEDAATRSDLPPSCLQLLNDALNVVPGAPQKQHTLAYITKNHCLLLDNAGQLRKLGSHYAPKDCGSWVYNFCTKENGFVWILDNWHSDINGMVYCTIFTYEAPSFRERTAYERHLKPKGSSLYTAHGNKLYIIPHIDQKYIECFDFGTGVWSQIHNPVPSPGRMWHATSLGDDLYVMNESFKLLRLRGDVLTVIRTDIALGQCMSDISMIAAHVWLYIYVTYTHYEEETQNIKHVVAYCYNTLSDIWTKLDPGIEGELTRNRQAHLLDNKIYIEVVHHEGKLCEYDIVTDTVKDSMRPVPPSEPFRPLLLDIDTQLFEADSSLPLQID